MGDKSLLYTYDDAVKVINGVATGLCNGGDVAVEDVGVLKSTGRILASDYVAPFGSPRFDNSAMDGYAVNSNGGVIKSGTQFEVVGSGVLVAGGYSSVDTHAVNGGKNSGAIKINTGAKVPAEYDTVVRIEDIDECKDEHGIVKSVFVKVDIDAKDNVRYAGSDVKDGSVIAKSGDVITPGLIAILSTFGIVSVKVYRKLKIGIITTGLEVRSAFENSNNGSVDNAEDAIFDSNTPYLMSYFDRPYIDVEYLGSVGDTPSKLLSILSDSCKKFDILITSGGVSMGTEDFVPSVIEQSGAEILIKGSKIRPGKPLIFGHYKSQNKNDASCVVFGLPGNPVSVGCCSSVYVSEYISTLLSDVGVKWHYGVINCDVSPKNNLTFFRMAGVSTDANGVTMLDVASFSQDSFRIGSFSRSAVWVKVSDAVKKGSIVPFKYI